MTKSELNNILPDKSREMQQFTPYFAGYENTVQPLNNSNQGQSQQPLNLNSSNIAVYPNTVAMQPLSAMTEQQRKDAQQLTELNSQGKPKRKQVKNACVNCQKACKKCDEGRPCQRCIKYGLTETCVNSVRKERKKGIKRGPYKKRNKTGNELLVASGASTPNITSMNTPAIYSNGNVRGNQISMPYQPFSVAGHYDPFQAVAYANSGQILPQAYMVPANIQQLPSGNPPVLAFQAAMNMLTPQQQQSQQQSQQQGGKEKEQEQNGGVSTPTTAVTTTTSSTTITTTAVDDDDEGSKLNILSQLCSEVLGNNNDVAPKQETDSIKSESHQNTPPPSRPHSRQTSNENNNTFSSSTNTDAVAAVAHTYLNGHLAPRTDFSSSGSTPNSPAVNQPHDS